MTHRTYYFEYNPSLVRLPASQIPELPGGEQAVYLASYRVSEIHFCLKDFKGQMNPDRLKRTNDEFLGIALLRSDLSVITDATVDLRKGGIRQQDF